MYEFEIIYKQDDEFKASIEIVNADKIEIDNFNKKLIFINFEGVLKNQEVIIGFRNLRRIESVTRANKNIKLN